MLQILNRMDFINKFSNYKKKILSFELVNKRVIFYSFLTSLIFFYPAIYGHGIYVDDLYRLKTGEFSWVIQGRPLTELIVRLYGMSHVAIDPSPFNWIFCIFIIGISAKIIYLRVAENYPKYAFTLALLFIINPYFIQNELYRFDSMGMALALFFGVLAYSINNKYYITKIFLLVVCLNFYQPTINIFLGLMAVEILLMFQKEVLNKTIIKFLVSCFFVFISATIIYYIETKLFLRATQGRGAMLAFSLSLPKELIFNIGHAIEPYIIFWKHYLIFIMPSVIVAMFIILKAIIYDKNMRIFYGYLVCIGVGLFSILGFMILLKYQMYLTEVRIYTYFPISLMILAVILISYKPILKWLLLPMVLICFIFSARVGNMQQIQTEYEKPILYGLNEDMYSIENKDNVREFYSLGNVPYSVFIRNNIDNIPFNGYLSRYGWRTTGAIMEYSDKTLKMQFDSDYVKEESRFNKLKKGLILVFDRPYYAIYINNDKEGWIVWKN